MYTKLVIKDARMSSIFAEYGGIQVESPPFARGDAFYVSGLCADLNLAELSAK